MVAVEMLVLGLVSHVNLQRPDAASVRDQLAAAQLRLVKEGLGWHGCVRTDNLNLHSESL